MFKSFYDYKKDLKRYICLHSNVRGHKLDMKLRSHSVIAKKLHIIIKKCIVNNKPENVVMANKMVSQLKRLRLPAKTCHQTTE